MPLMGFVTRYTLKGCSSLILSGFAVMMLRYTISPAWSPSTGYCIFSSYCPFSSWLTTADNAEDKIPSPLFRNDVAVDANNLTTSTTLA